MPPASNTPSRGDTRVLAVGMSALILGVAVGALAAILATSDGKAFKVGASRSVADWHDRALDLLRAGREKIERAADNRA